MGRVDGVTAVVALPHKLTAFLVVPDGDVVSRAGRASEKLGAFGAQAPHLAQVPWIAVLLVRLDQPLQGRLEACDAPLAQEPHVVTP